MGCHPNPIDELHDFSRCLSHFKSCQVTNQHDISSGIPMNFLADFHHPKKTGGLEVVVEARSAFAGAAMGRSWGI